MGEIRTIPRFHLLASRRFMLDNEIVLSEFVPGTVVCPSLQNGAMPYCPAPPRAAFGGGAMTLSAPPEAAAEGTFFVGGFFPGIHFSADVRSLSPGAAALLDIAPPDGSILFRVRAEPGKPVSFAETRGAANLACALANPQVVPPPPFRLSAVVAGPTVLLAARKDGDVRFLGSVTLDETPETVPLSRLPRYERL